MSHGQVHDEASPSLPRVRAARVPLLQRYYEMLRLPMDRPTALSLVRLAVPFRAPVFVSPLKPDAGLGPGALRSGSPYARIFEMEFTGSPRFPGSPDAPTPCSPTPAGADTPRRIGVPAVAPVVSKTKAPTGSTLGAQSHGLDASCLRFARTIAGQDARLASGGWLDPAGWDWLPTGLL